MIENASITITETDISEANQLSLHCPICAGAVERHTTIEALKPIYCLNCETLYHEACWAQGGSKCAVLGCGCKEYRQYSAESGDVLKITYDDLPKQARPSVNGLPHKRLKADEKRRTKVNKDPWWAIIFRRLLQAIKILE